MRSLDADGPRPRLCLPPAPPPPQDDAHIFCLPDQIAGEIERVLDLVEQASE